MGGTTLDEGRNNSGLRSSGEGVVLLQRRDGKGSFRKHDEARDERGSTSSLPNWPGTGEVDSVASLNIEGLTLGESLLISRRRSGESQEKIADRLGMTRNVYGRVERDDEDVPSGIQFPELGELSQDEICLILRRRSGLTQEECADKIGVTRFWFNQMETGKVSLSLLTKFWESRA
jgi:DNA-binding XRE family transcriptional regulator